MMPLLALLVAVVSAAIMVSVNFIISRTPRDAAGDAAGDADDADVDAASNDFALAA